MTGILRGDLADAIGGPIPAEAAASMIGIVGEWAVAIAINEALGTDLHPDLENRPSGDPGYDLIVRGLKIDVKTRKRENDVDYVRCRTEFGTPLILKADVYVFCKWNLTTAATIFGCLSKTDITGCSVQKSFAGGHDNYVVGNDDLLPFGRLITDLKGRE